MSEMSNQNSENNGINRAGPVGEGSSASRCSLVRQRGPGRHPTTVRTKWSKIVNMIVMECYFRPVVVGALGCISKSFSGWMGTLGFKLNVGMVQKSVLLGTARILRKVLDM